MTGNCALCGRAELLTRHHLIPQVHIRKNKHDEVAVLEARRKIIRICEPCHVNIHNCFSESQLAAKYNSLTKLKKHTKIASFTAWIKKRPTGFRPSKKKQRRSK